MITEIIQSLDSPSREARYNISINMELAFLDCALKQSYLSMCLH